MAGPRANLAVTKDGETYNKLQRPDDFLNQSAAPKPANERKRERGALDTPAAGPFAGNKRPKTQHVGSTAKVPQPSAGKQPHRSGGTIADCGMRTTLPIDEEETQHSDDSLGDALAYLRSVRSEASTIPHLLVAANESKDTNTKSSQASTARTGQHTFYRDGAWIAIDEGYGATRDEYELGDPDLKDLYQKQLVKRFETLRYSLADKTSGLDAGIEPSSGKLPSNRHEWLYTIDREYPTRGQICRLDEKSVRRGLEYCAHAMDRFETISSQKSCWIWTLLALSGDVGTLDSQKLSHIRDLGVKAGEMSVSLHSGSARQTNEPGGDTLHGDPADEEQYDEPEAAFCDAGADGCDFGTGYVQPRVSAERQPGTDNLHDEGVSRSQHNPHSHVPSPGTSDVLIDVQESTNNDTNDDTLERARARLLAQLGDNLVQAGIPTSTPDTDDTHLHRFARPHQGSDESQHETQIRAIPSRAEAERQRQLMRAQDSATASLGEPTPSSAKPSTAAHSVEADGSADDIDLNTRVTIDMILTVVAECYGQRDLLKFRQPW